MKKTWADILIESMLANNITRIYWYPWWANIPLYDRLNFNNEIEHVLVRHEQAASFGAQWDSRTSDKIWTCLVTSGPWASNALTWVYDAYMDSIPMIFITAQVPYSVMGNDVFQEMDTIWATMSFTKHSFLISDVNSIPQILNEAVKIATTGKPWPVHIDIPKDIQNHIYSWDEKITWYKKPENIEKKYEISDEVISQVVKELKKSKNPILLVWQWVRLSRAEKELNKFVDILWIPTVTTLHWKWILNENNKNYLWMVWMHWFYHANNALYHADLIINIWSRFDDRIVWTYDSFAKNSIVVHVDINKSELNKLVNTDIAILSDAKYFLNRMLEKNLTKLEIDSWQKRINTWNETYPFEKNSSHFWIKNTLQIINSITESNLENYIFCTDVWQHQMWSAQVIKVAYSRAWLTSWWAWTMGFALPTSIWAAFSNPDKTIIVIAWDWWIQMNIQELQLLKDYDLNIKVIVVNNSFLWMVRQWQDLFHDKNYSHTPITSPNFKKIAEAYDINWYSTCEPKEFEKIFSEEVKKKWPALIEVVIKKQEDNVYPMIAPWTRLDQTITK